MYNQGQALRADPTQLTVPQLVIQVGRPTFIPNMAIPAQMQQVFPVLVSIVQIEIESKIANGSPIRIHAHNLCAANNFQNPDFYELVEIVTKYIHHLMTFGQQFTDIQACMVNIIPDVVGAWSAAQVKTFPDLARYLNPNSQGTVMNAINLMGKIVQDIMNGEQGQFQQQQGYQNNNQGNQGNQQTSFGGQQSGYGGSQQNNGYGNNGGNNGWERISPLQPNPNFGGVGRGPAGGAGLFVTGNRMPQPEAAPQLGPKSSTSKSRMMRQLMVQNGQDPDPPPTNMTNAMNDANDRQAAQQAHRAQETSQIKGTSAPTQAEPSGTSVKKWRANRTAADVAGGMDHWAEIMGKRLEGPVSEPTEAVTIHGRAPDTQTASQDQSYVVEASEKIVTMAQWKPSKHQPYHPAWLASKHKCEYTQLDDGSVVAVIVDKSESEQAMNQADHAIGVRPTTKAAFIRQPDQTVTKTIENDEILAIEHPSANISFINNDDIGMEVSDRVPAVMAGMLGVMGGWVDNKHTAWHTTTWICDPVLTTSQEVVDYLVQSIDRARDCKTFGQLHEVMQQMTSPDELVLRQRINQYMTRAINDMIAFNLSSNIFIDDFEADGATIVDQLSALKGERVGKAFSSMQEQLIRSNLRSLDDSSSKTMVDSFKAGLEIDKSNWAGGMTFLANKVTHTHLQYSGAELDLAMPRRHTAMLTEEKTPVLYKVAEQIFNEDDPVSADFARHFIVTSDGVVLMLTRGLLNTQAYLVRIMD